MKQRLLFLIFFVFTASACTSALETTLQQHPEILFKVIKKNPKAFFDTVQAAQLELQKKSRLEAEKKAKTAMEQEFKTPKKADISKQRTVFGNPKAEVTIVEYSDFQCPYCSRAAKTMDKIFEKYGDKVKLVYKHLPYKPYARIAAQYYEAVALQSGKKAKKFHDIVYANQSALRKGGEKYLKQVVKEVKANSSRVAKDYKNKIIAEIIDKDEAEAKKFGFTGTPGFIVGGVTVKGAYPFKHFETIIDRHLKK